MEDFTNTRKVFCLGDGYAHGHIWPEWPQIMQTLRPDLDVVVISAIGAGHEFLINELLTKNIRGSTVIFQWPHHSRFDKLVEDSVWKNIIQSDPVYHFNTYKTKQGTWWCSSASSLDIVQQYHRTYIQDQQSYLRQKNQMTLVESYVTQQSKYVSTSNIEQETFAKDIKFLHCRGNEVQPLPLLHYHWLMESILPAAGIDVNDDISQELLSRITSHNWVPYDPNRDEIWRNMSTNLGNNL